MHVPRRTCILKKKEAITNLLYNNCRVILFHTMMYVGFFLKNMFGGMLKGRGL